MKKSGFFWVGYADLMTSLFFIMLVLYVVSFALFKNQLKDVAKGKEDLEITINKLEKTKKLLLVQAEKAKIIEAVEQNLEPLKKRGDLFKYDKKFKRFSLAFNVEYIYGMTRVNKESLKNYRTISELIRVGKELEIIIEKLRIQKEQDSKFKDISYLIVVSGSASDMNEAAFRNYKTSYERAYFLYQFWKDNGIDLDANKYHDLVDFQIAGNGTGGVGRFKDEKKNQRFIINIIPKIGEVN